MRYMKCVVLFSYLLIACASPVDVDQFEEATTVWQPGAGDEKCSLPSFASWIDVPRECCLTHDLAYEHGRDNNAPEHDRAIADSLLYTCVLQYRHQAIADVVYLGVRIGGWYTWHCGGE